MNGRHRPTRSPPRRAFRVVGLDLAGSPHRDTGACTLTGPRRLKACVLHTDQEILEYIDILRPNLVVIDAPLSLPRGRRTIEDRSGPHLRACDRELLRRRLPFFPLTLGPMRMLTVRGMTLAESIGRSGAIVLEGYPGGAQDLVGLPRKKAGVRLLQRGLRSLGLGGDLLQRELSHDELDAVTIAWVGWEHHQGRGLIIGDPNEGLMLLPQPKVGRPSVPSRAPRTGAGSR